MSLVGRRRRREERGADRSTTARTRDAVTALQAQGWVLPDSLVGDRPPVSTDLGVVDAPWTASIDGRGAVSPLEGWFTLDWAIGAEDRWHVPAREARVEQTRLGHAPVVETRLRIPGGQVVHRAFVGRGSSFPRGDEWIVIEVENATSTPIALAWVVRPWAIGEVSHVSHISLSPVDEDQRGSGPWHLSVGELAAVLPRRPSRWAAGAGDDGGPDPLAAVLAGEASADWEGVNGRWPADAVSPVDAPAAWSAQGDLSVRSDDGLASLALLVPVPHTAVSRILLPRGVWPSAREAEVGWPVERPEVERVVAGWTLHADRGPRVEIPDPVLSDAVAGARRSLLLRHRVHRKAATSDREAVPAAHTITTGGRVAAPAGDRMEVLAALGWWGGHDTVDRVLAHWPDDQQRGGGFGSPEATASALRALAVHAIACGDAGAARAWLPEVGGAIEHLGKVLRKPRPGTDLAVVAEGLDAGALLLARLGQPDAAARITVAAATAHDRSSAPGGDDRAAGGPAGSAPSGDRLDLDAPSTTPRALAAAAVAAARDGQPSEALWALLRRASATWTWSDPERWVGDDGLIPARLLDAVARLLVADRPAGPAVLPWLPPSWWGRGWEVHDAPTRWGRLSYAVRWHGERPALLWDLAGEADGDPVITAPGLDPTWSSRERRGEALLAAVPPPPEVAMTLDEVVPTGVAVAAPPRSVWRPQDPGPDAPDSPPAPPPDPDPGARTDPEPPEGGSFT